jgi:S1-C subfamily serine protease
MALTDLFKAFEASLLLIQVEPQDAATAVPRKEGTGFLIGRPNYLLTAASLFTSRSGGPVRIKVSQQMEETASRDAQLVGLDETTGLALLRIAEPVSAPALKLSQGQIEPADNVSVLGFQSAHNLSVSVSLVVSKSAGLLSLDLSAASTMVGAPIIDNNGEVIGVLIRAGAPRSVGIPARSVSRFLESASMLR